MIAKVAKLVIPKAMRHPIHEFIISLTNHSWTLFRFYLWLLFGKTVKGIKSIEGNKALYNYKGHDIVTPRNSVHIFKEIFLDEIYERKFKPSGTVVDVGAYVGMFSIKAALVAKEVVAIEPFPETFELLKSNCAPISNIKVVNKAVSSKTGTINLYLARSTYGNSITNKTPTYIEIEAITLDDLLGKPVDFIKIDTEGAEMEILKGATRTLSYPGTKLAIAAYHRLPNGEPELPYITAFLEDKGYKVCIIEEYIYAEK